MTLLHAVILGIVEGITEFLPISSTGHLILASRFLGLEDTDFVKSFIIIIQLGAMAAVVLLYFRSLLNIEILKRLAIGFVPTGIAGLLLYGAVKEFFGSTSVVAYALLIGGIVLIVLEILIRNPNAYVESSSRMQAQIVSEISYSKAALIGLFQVLALIPGVSRSGATIAGGLLLGIPRAIIVEFSFLLAVPTLAAASGYDIMKNYSIFSSSQIWVLLVGFAVSCIVALVSIKFLLRFVRTNTFIPFGIYRIAVGVALLAFIALNVL